MATGFFGKVPAAGDFVARGLGPGMRRVLDLWLTEHMVEMAREAVAWPEGGVRVLLDNGAPHLIVIEPSGDSAGRRYPLAACVAQGGAGRMEANVWADRVWNALLTATEAGDSPDILMDKLARIGDPRPGKDPLIPPLVWWPGIAPAQPSIRLPELRALSSG